MARNLDWWTFTIKSTNFQPLLRTLPIQSGLSKTIIWGASSKGKLEHFQLAILNYAMSFWKVQLEKSKSFFLILLISSKIFHTNFCTFYLQFKPKWQNTFSMWHWIIELDGLFSYLLSWTAALYIERKRRHNEGCIKAICTKNNDSQFR